MAADLEAAHKHTGVPKVRIVIAALREYFRQRVRKMKATSQWGDHLISRYAKKKE